MAGTLQRGTFELAGAIADGAITWLCPAPYLRDIGIPSMAVGAEKERPRPPVVAHVAVCVHDNAEEVRSAVRAGIPNIMFPSYQRMLVPPATPTPRPESGLTNSSTRSSLGDRPRG